MLLSTYFQKQFFYLVVAIIFTQLVGWHTIAQAKEASIEEILSDNVVFFQVIHVATDDTLSIRESATSKSRQLGQIPSNHKNCIAYLNEKQDVGSGSQKWVKITYQGIQGWVNLHYLERNWESSCGTYYQIINVPRNDVLNMRESPKVSGKTVGAIPYDYEDCLTGLDEKQKWVLLDYEGTKGWVSSNYLKTISVDDCDI